MRDYDDLSLEELARLAAREARGSGYSEVALASLAGAVIDDAALQQAIREELAPRAANLELHLDGENVVDHSTNALSFGWFVSRISDTVREFVKGRLHLPAFSNDLRVAVGAGSVRATFIAPDPVTDADNSLADDHRGQTVWTDVNLQSEALHQIAIILANSDPVGLDDDVLDGAIGLLPFGSRVKLRSAIRQTVKQDWAIKGEFRQRGVGVQQIDLQPSAARFLLAHLEGEELAEDTLTTTGVLDGHLWSGGVMYFIPVTGRKFPATFASTEVQQQVGILDAVEGRRVEATFRVFTRVGSGESDRKSTSYVLESVTPLDDGPGTLLEIN